VKPPRLYAIADLDALGPSAVAPAVEAMASAGIAWIQVRAKRAADRDLYALVDDCMTRIAGSGTALWIDDRADVAALFPVFGVHVGQRDLPPAAVRRVLGAEVAIGLSTHDEDQLRAADADPDVDVVAIGPVFPTRSKRSPDPVVGLEGLRRLRGRTRKPLLAIGGIDATNLASVLATGADAAVVLGAVCHGDVAANSRRLVTLAEAAR